MRTRPAASSEVTGRARILLACAAFSAAGVAEAASLDDIPATVLIGLESDAPRVRVTAISAVAQTQSPLREPILRGMLRDPHAAVRTAALLALVDMQVDDLEPTLVRLAKTDPDPLVRQAASDAQRARARPSLRPTAADTDRRVARQVLTLAVDTVVDRTGQLNDDLIRRFEAGLRQALTAERRVRVVDTRVDGVLASPEIHSIQTTRGAALTRVVATCAATLVRLPGRALLTVASVDATAGIEAQTSAAEHRELIEEALSSCAPALVGEITAAASRAAVPAVTNPPLPDVESSRTRGKSGSPPARARSSGARRAP